jgi:hypothetical protein
MQGKGNVLHLSSSTKKIMMLSCITYCPSSQVCWLIFKGKRVSGHLHMVDWHKKYCSAVLMQGTRQGNVFLNGSKVADIYITQLYLYGYCHTVLHTLAINMIKYTFTLIIWGLCADCSVRLAELLTCLPDLHSH